MCFLNFSAHPRECFDTRVTKHFKMYRELIFFHNEECSFNFVHTHWYCTSTKGFCWLHHNSYNEIQTSKNSKQIVWVGNHWHFAKEELWKIFYICYRVLQLFVGNLIFLTMSIYRIGSFDFTRNVVKSMVLQNEDIYKMCSHFSEAVINSLNSLSYFHSFWSILFVIIWIILWFFMNALEFFKP